MKQVLNGILKAEKAGEKLLAALIDPEKFNIRNAGAFLEEIPGNTTHIFIGGSTTTCEELESCTRAVKAESDLPVILFPGDYRQISRSADAILFLSLLSGRNPEYLIGQQVKSVPYIRESSLEIIPTGYLLIDGGTASAVQKVSGTAPLLQNDVDLIVHTALAAEYSGKQLVYLEAGSGARRPVDPLIISEVKRAVKLPVISGGGIRNRKQLDAAYSAGADLVVIGTAFEEGNFLRH